MLAALALALMIAPAPDRGGERTIMAAIEHCLHHMPAGSVPLPSRNVPPGLMVASPAVTPLIPGSKAVAYEGTGSGAVICGVAIYQRVSPALADRIARLLAADVRFRAASPDKYRADGPSAHLRYWGLQNAPGVSGVMLAQRPPGHDAPTLEVQYHDILIP